MKLSIFDASDWMLGQVVSPEGNFDDPISHTGGGTVGGGRYLPAAPPDKVACNCLYGTPYIDANGNCGCTNDPVVVSGPATPSQPKVLVRSGPEGVFAYAPLGNQQVIDTTNLGKGSAAGTIAGIDTKTLWILAAVAGGLWLMSNMGETKKRKVGE